MFYERLKELCKKRGTSVTAMSKKLGLSSGNVTNWKNGRNPKTEIIIKIANYLGVSVEYLMGNNESNNSTKTKISEEDIKVALFGGDDADADKKFEDVKRYIDFLNSKKD
jgi:transcriptional regulator with XRE-family HTH domain